VVLLEMPDRLPQAQILYCVPAVTATGTVATVVLAAVWVTVLQLVLIWVHALPARYQRQAWTCSLVLAAPAKVAVPMTLLPDRTGVWAVKGVAGADGSAGA
jgi:hypothetical protein